MVSTHTYSLTHLEPGPLPERELLRIMLAVDRVDDGGVASRAVLGGLAKGQQLGPLPLGPHLLLILGLLLGLLRGRLPRLPLGGDLGKSRRLASAALLVRHHGVARDDGAIGHGYRPVGRGGTGIRRRKEGGAAQQKEERMELLSTHARS